MTFEDFVKDEKSSPNIASDAENLEPKSDVPIEKSESAVSTKEPLNLVLSPSQQRRRITVFIICSSLYFFTNFHRVIVSVLTDELSVQYGVDKGRLSLFSSVYFYSYAIMQVAGSFSDVIDPSWLLAASGFVTAIGSVITGLTHNFALALVGRAIIGMALALVFLPAIRVLISWYDADGYAFMNSVLLFIGGIGSLVGSYPLKAAAQAFGVPATMIVCSAITFALAILSLMYIRASPFTTSDSLLPPVLRDSTGPMTTRAVFRKVVANSKVVLKTKDFYMVAIHGFFNTGAYFTLISFWSLEFIVAAADTDSSHGSAVMMVLGLMFAVGSIAWSMLSHRFKTRKKCLVVACIVTIAVEGTFTVKSGGYSLAVITVLLTVYAFTSDSVVTIIYTSIKERFPVELSGAAMSWVNFVMFIGSAIIQQVTSSTVKPCEGGEYCASSFNRGLWSLLLGGQVVALACILMWPETYGQEAGASPASVSVDDYAESEGDIVRIDSFETKV